MASCDLLLEFCDPLHISGTVEARNFEFGMQMDSVSNYKEKMKKHRSKGS